jgi:hypothetical protein
MDDGLSIGTPGEGHLGSHTLRIDRLLTPQPTVDEPQNRTPKGCSLCRPCCLQAWIRLSWSGFCGVTSIVPRLQHQPRELHDAQRRFAEYTTMGLRHGLG